MNAKEIYAMLNELVDNDDGTITESGENRNELRVFLDTLENKPQHFNMLYN